MRRRAQRTHHSIERLRSAIDCMPVETRLAMLRAIGQNDIIVGAYSTSDGGVCPMLAAHRCGGRTSLISFAHAWDRFARPGRKPRRATERELKILAGQLEVSLLAERRWELNRAIADHAQLVRERRARARHAARADAEAARPDRSAEPPSPRPGDPDRSRELRHRSGWAWLRPMRRYDEYERALALLEDERLRLEHEGAVSMPPVA